MKVHSIYIFGAGKVGQGLAKAMGRAGYSVTLRSQRRGLPKAKLQAQMVILAVRDRELAAVAGELATRGLIGHEPVVVAHCAGALGPEVLHAIRGPRIFVAQMHPMISFASRRFTPSLESGQLHVDGDKLAVRVLRDVGKKLGFTPRTIPHLDRVAYHAAAGLVANGAAALAAAGVDLLEKAGVDPATATQMLGPLLRSVSENVAMLGLPEALTGPVRRGDAAAVGRHLELLRRIAPGEVPLYLACATTQLKLARVLADATPAAFDEVERVLRASLSAPARKVRARR